MVLMAKFLRLLQQAVPVVMLVMQVIDETNHAGTSSSDEPIDVSSDQPIDGNSADEQNGPRMNADKRRWNKKAVLIGVHPRSSAVISQKVPPKTSPLSNRQSPCR
jgi:hypothetical protein